MTQHPGSRPARPALASLAPAVVLAAALAGCGAPKLPGIYRIDIQQGNEVTQEMLDRLEPGMPKRKVRLVLGTPLIVDTFNQDRWDYIYSFQEGGGDRVQRRISLYFEDEKLARVQGDVLAGSRAPPEAARSREVMVSVPPRTRDKGFIDAITPGFLKRDRAPAKPPEPAEAPEASASAPAEAAGAPDAGSQASGGATEQPAEGTTASVAPEASTTTETDDPGFLERLFKGFGRAPGTEEAEAEAEAEARVEAAGARPETAAAEPPAPEEAESEDGGFFSRLMRRFRGAEAAEPETAPDPEAAGAPGGELAAEPPPPPDLPAP